MAPANKRTHKDMAVSRVPLRLARKIEQDARHNALSASDIMRRILLQHYGLLKPAA